jgi:hypothetical protein
MGEAPVGPIHDPEGLGGLFRVQDHESNRPAGRNVASQAGGGWAETRSFRGAAPAQKKRSPWRPGYRQIRVRRCL